MPRQAEQTALPRTFFAKSACTVARQLLGKQIVHGPTAGIIVETEAYDQTDPASHSYRRPTPRTRAMFGPGGFAYVYRSYGIHWCINVSCGPDGFGAAVLIRAIEPTAGLDIMAERRGLDGKSPLLLARGPGRITQALGITGEHNGADLLQGELRIEAGSARENQVIATPRIGITQGVDLPWRFVYANCRYVSGPARLNRDAR